jgi:type IV pilus assembly protein PilC
MKPKGGTKKSVLAVNLDLVPASHLDLIIFAKHLSLMLKSGLVITAALKILYQSAQGKFKDIIGDIYASVKAGRSLATALKRYPKVFSSFFIGAVYAGESSGTLDQSLANVSNQLRKEKELADKIRAALLYPIIILVAGFLMSLFLAFYILPKIVPLFVGLKMKLPWTTRVLIAFAQVVQHYGVVLLVAILAAVALLLWLVKQRFAQPFFHRLWLGLPIVQDMIRQANLARLARTLGTLLASGLNIVEALDITAQTTTNYYYRQALLAVNRATTKGNRLSAGLSKFRHLFPDMAVQMISVGEESGKLEETLSYLADFYELEVDNATKNLSTLVEPILLVLIGLGVGFLALSIITPIYSITGTVGK